jgi:hypothetical protein
VVERVAELLGTTTAGGDGDEVSESSGAEDDSGADEDGSGDGDRDGKGDGPSELKSAELLGGGAILVNITGVLDGAGASLLGSGASLLGSGILLGSGTTLLGSGTKLDDGGRDGGEGDEVLVGVGD